MPEMKSLTLNGKTYDNFVDQTARSMSMGSAVIDSASGENITLTDASKYNLLELHIYGKTTQNGIPTPDAPVELESVGDSGSITVNVTGEKESQSMTVSTPNGLPGIPVTSGGNYTDENGKQWVCDEIDFARGVYVKRVAQDVLTGEPRENWSLYTTDDYSGFNRPVSDMVVSMHGRGYCNRLQVHNNANTNLGIWFGVGNNVMYVHNARGLASNVNNWLNWLSNNPLHILYVLATPIETPLSEEELAAYAELHTYRDNTAITNDASAHMDIEYVMDAKKYIESLIGSGGASQARLTSVTIRASAWQTTAENLHSQVVTIDGVTPYSKVDLLPSVEQLAIFHNKDVAFVTENEGGVVTVYAIGDRPNLDYTMQAQITEVVV